MIFGTGEQMTEYFFWNQLSEPDYLWFVCQKLFLCVLTETVRK